MLKLLIAVCQWICYVNNLQFLCTTEYFLQLYLDHHELFRFLVKEGQKAKRVSLLRSSQTEVQLYRDGVPCGCNITSLVNDLSIILSSRARTSRLVYDSFLFTLLISSFKQLFVMSLCVYLLNGGQFQK